MVASESPLFWRRVNTFRSSPMPVGSDFTPLPLESALRVVVRDACAIFDTYLAEGYYDTNIALLTCPSSMYLCVNRSPFQVNISSVMRVTIEDQLKAFVVKYGNHSDAVLENHEGVSGISASVGTPTNRNGNIAAARIGSVDTFMHHESLTPRGPTPASGFVTRASILGLSPVMTGRLAPDSPLITAAVVTALPSPNMISARGQASPLPIPGSLPSPVNFGANHESLMATPSLATTVMVSPVSVPLVSPRNGSDTERRRTIMAIAAMATTTSPRSGAGNGVSIGIVAPSSPIGRSIANASPPSPAASSTLSTSMQQYHEQEVIRLRSIFNGAQEAICHLMHANMFTRFRSSSIYEDWLAEYRQGGSMVSNAPMLGSRGPMQSRGEGGAAAKRKRKGGIAPSPALGPSHGGPGHARRASDIDDLQSEISQSSVGGPGGGGGGSGGSPATAPIGVRGNHNHSPGNSNGGSGSGAWPPPPLSLGSPHHRPPNPHNVNNGITTTIATFSGSSGGPLAATATPSVANVIMSPRASVLGLHFAASPPPTANPFTTIGMNGSLYHGGTEATISAPGSPGSPSKKSLTSIPTNNTPPSRYFSNNNNATIPSNSNRSAAYPFAP
jgi:hypothetical protein